MRSYAKSALKSAFFPFPLWYSAFDMMKTVLLCVFTVKRNLYCYLGRTFYGSENTSAGWKQHCTSREGEHEHLNVSFEVLKHIIQMKRGDLTLKMT